MNGLALNRAIDLPVVLRGVGEHLCRPGRPNAGVRLDCGLVLMVPKVPVDQDDAHRPVETPPVELVGAAHLARASAHSRCPQSGAWPHQGTTSDVEQEPQTKIRSLAVQGSLGALVALEERRAGRAGRVVIARCPLSSRGGLAMNCLPELGRRFPG